MSWNLYYNTNFTWRTKNQTAVGLKSCTIKNGLFSSLRKICAGRPVATSGPVGPSLEPHWPRSKLDIRFARPKLGTPTTVPAGRKDRGNTGIPIATGRTRSAKQPGAYANDWRLTVVQSFASKTEKHSSRGCPAVKTENPAQVLEISCLHAEALN